MLMTKSFNSLVILDIQTEVLWGSGKIKNTHMLFKENNKE